MPMPFSSKPHFTLNNLSLYLLLSVSATLLMLNQQECAAEYENHPWKEVFYPIQLPGTFAGPSDAMMTRRTTTSLEEFMGSADSQFAMSRALMRFPNMTRISRDSGNEQYQRCRVQRSSTHPHCQQKPSQYHNHLRPSKRS